MTNHENTRSNAEVMSLEELVHTLELAGINLDTWGQGKAKTLAHLHKEIIEGESALNVTENGAERKVGVAGVDVLYHDQGGKVYRLVEDRQEFRDGRVRRRQMETSLSEKLKVDEDPEAAAKRALEEEIGIEKVNTFYTLGHKEVVRTSESYPGLNSIYDTYLYASILSPEDFNPEGYVEEQPDKTSFYVWSPISADTTSQ